MMNADNIRMTQLKICAIEAFLKNNVTAVVK